MKYLYVPNQDRLKYAYESGKAREGYDLAKEEEYRKRLHTLPVYTNEKDAVNAFFNLRNTKKGNAIIWANIGVDEEYFYIKDDYFLVADDNLMHQAAEYLGMIELCPFKTLIR